MSQLHVRHVKSWPTHRFVAFLVHRIVIFEVYDCGEHLVRHCDRFVQSRHANHGERLHAAAYTNSKMLAGRLLHYFSPDEGNSTEDAWCGWHNDT